MLELIGAVRACGGRIAMALKKNYNGDRSRWQDQL